MLLVVGDDINLYDAGEIWHLVDYRMRMPITLRSRDSLNGIDWSRYTHVIFPSGDYEDYQPDYADRLRLWVAEGGTVIGMRDAAAWLRATTLDWVDPENEEALAAAESEDTDEEEEAESLERLSYSDKDDFEAAESHRRRYFFRRPRHFTCHSGLVMRIGRFSFTKISRSHCFRPRTRSAR